MVSRPHRVIAATLAGGVVAVLLGIISVIPKTLQAEKPGDERAYQFVMEIGKAPTGHKRDYFFYPRGIAIGPDGNIYIADTNNHQIAIFDQNGNLLKKWGSFGTETPGLKNPFGVFVDPEGLVYVSDSGNSRIQVFKRDGTFLRAWGGRGHRPGQMQDPLIGITMDQAGHIYLADTSNHRIQKFDRTGKLLLTWGKQGKRPGQLWNPFGITVDDEGYVYVADTFNARFQKFTNKGVFITHEARKFPSASNRWMRAFQVSATWTFPFRSTAIPIGK